jgi:outer membrane lipoprotein SlyB
MNVFSKVFRVCLIITLSLFLLSACVTTGDKQADNAARTTAGGAGLGALIGGAIGVILGDNKESAVIGAMVGGVVGTVLGSLVADRKNQYATNEALLEGETKKTAQLVDKTRQVNRGLRSDIATYKTEIASLKGRVRRGSAKQSDLQVQRQKAKKRSESAKKALEGVQKELKVAKTLYSEQEKAYRQKSTRYGKQKKQRDRRDVEAAKKLKAYDSQIAALEREKRTLEGFADELSAMAPASSY